MAWNEQIQEMVALGAAAIGGLLMEMLVALYLMPCLYQIFTGGEKAASK